MTADSAAPATAPLLLLASLTPAVFEMNAFRVLGVPVTATAREIEREVERAQMQAEFGDGGALPKGATHSGPASLRRAANADEWREARQRLTQPEQRIVDEFLWFWPLRPADGATDVALGRLGEGDLQSAIDLWQSALSDPVVASAARHNLAIAWFAHALDAGLPTTPPPLPGTAAREDANATAGDRINRWWAASVVHWRETLADEEVWSRVSERIRQLDDPQLTTGFGRRLREGLPQALIRLHAQLGLDRVEDGAAPAAAEAQARWIESYHFAEGVVIGTLEEFLAPLKTRLENACNTLLTDSETTPANGVANARRLLAEHTQAVSVVDAFLPPENLFRMRVHDRLALSASGCLAEEINPSRQWDRWIEFMPSLLGLAVGEVARTKLKENLGQLKTLREEQQLYETCWFCEREAGVAALAKCFDHHKVTAREGTTVRYQTRAIKVPYCASCQKAHARIGMMATWLFVFAGGLGFFVAQAVVRPVGSAILFAFAFACLACAVLHLVHRAKMAKPIKPAYAASKHPLLALSRKEGWVLGAKPPNTT